MRSNHSSRLCVAVIGVLLVATGAGHATTLDISVNYAHDWVSGVTDPFAVATVMLRDSGGSLKATGLATADAAGYFLVGGEAGLPPLRTFSREIGSRRPSPALRQRSIRSGRFPPS